MIRNLVPRLYQETILGTATQHNTLVVLPTGMGKTAIFLLLAVHRLQLYPKSKVLFVGPTRPLIDQYREVFRKHTTLPETAFATLTGMVSPAKRHQLWNKATVIFSTPQGLENDLLSGNVSLENVALLGVDEAHRAVGNYAYVFLAQKYHRQARHERLLALTASPGDTEGKIEDVCTNLFIDKIELRTPESPDVKPYTQEVEVETKHVVLPEPLKEIQSFFHKAYTEKLAEVRRLGYLRDTGRLHKVGIITLQNQLHSRLSQGENDYGLLRSISLLAEALKLLHAIELVETQDPSALKQYMNKLQTEAAMGRVKATANLVKDLNVRSASIKLDRILDEHVNHPKLDALKTIVCRHPEKKIIVFSQYRDMGEKIVEQLQQEKIEAKLFVGQQKKRTTGLSQKKQQALIAEFRKGTFRVLVSSSVGEEGLDIPQVDLVVFYEPIPSAIRKIQRSGRTGRLEKGKVIVLSTKNTRDEAYHWVSLRKEKRMRSAIRNVQQGLSRKPVRESLNDFVKKKIEEENLSIVADYREKNSSVLKQLANKEIKIALVKLEVGDYQLGNEIVVEYKTVQDFVDSLIDGRLLSQLKQLRRVARPLLIVEGVEDIYAVRKVHHNAIKGMLATIVSSYGIPLLQTRNSQETADLFEIIARREHQKGDGRFTTHMQKPLSLKEQQEYVVASFPGVGPVLNKPLLRHFKSIRAMVNADVEDLRSVELIGPKKAKALQELFKQPYNTK